MGETEAQDDDLEAKQHNADFARERVQIKKSKQLLKKQAELEQIKAKIEQGQELAGLEFKAKDATPEPMLDDFISDDRLYGEFKGESAIALAKYNEAHSQWERSNQSISTQRDEHKQKLLDDVNALRAVEHKFEQDIEKSKKISKSDNIEVGIDKAVEILGDRAFNFIRERIDGDLSPLVLSHLGSNMAEMEKVQAFFTSADKNSELKLVRHLTRLEDRIVNGLPKQTHVSQAKAEEPISGGASSAMNLDKEIAKINKRTDLTAFDKAMERKALKKKAESLAS